MGGQAIPHRPVASGTGGTATESGGLPTLPSEMAAERDLIQAVRRELQAWNADRRQLGFRHAGLRRLRYHAAAEFLGEQIELERASRTALESKVTALEAQLRVLEDEVMTLRGNVTAIDVRMVDFDTVRHHVGAQDTELLVRRTTDWVGQGRLATAPLVTVVLPTRDRATFVPRAIQSVLDQGYANWELIVVDDGSVDDTSRVLTSFDDVRIRRLYTAGVGACAARNAALDIARGELVTYIDDDNTMHPNWLSAVVWAFERRPAVDVVYGAFIVDEVKNVDLHGAGAFPQLYFFAYDHLSLVEANIADMGAIAHRAGLEGARFDESLRELGDWDLLLRLTRDKPPLSLPVIACFYATDAPTRLTGGPSFAADEAIVRAKHRR